MSPHPPQPSGSHPASSGGRHPPPSSSVSSPSSSDSLAASFASSAGGDRALLSRSLGGPADTASFLDASLGSSFPIMRELAPQRTSDRLRRSSNITLTTLLSQTSASRLHLQEPPARWTSRPGSRTSSVSAISVSPIADHLPAENLLGYDGTRHRWRINTEEKAKVVAAGCGTYLNAALNI